MSAIRLLCVVLLASYASSAYVKINGDVSPNAVQIVSKTHHILVEEVDKNGNSVVKDLELPDFDESEEARADKERREQQQREFKKEAELHQIKREEMNECNLSDKKLRRKCLRNQKRLLKREYRRWKREIDRVMNDINAQLKNLNNGISEESDNLNYASGYSPGDERTSTER